MKFLNDILSQELLIDDFFIALLRMGSRKTGTKPLSFSRLKIATESLPILLGGDARMWQRWIFMFSRIPGGLFVIREKIPVRGEPQLLISDIFISNTTKNILLWYSTSSTMQILNYLRLCLK